MLIMALQLMSLQTVRGRNVTVELSCNIQLCSIILNPVSDFRGLSFG